MFALNTTGHKINSFCADSMLFDEGPGFYLTSPEKMSKLLNLV